MPVGNTSQIAPEPRSYVTPEKVDKFDKYLGKHSNLYTKSKLSENDLANIGRSNSCGWGWVKRTI